MFDQRRLGRVEVGCLKRYGGMFVTTMTNPGALEYGALAKLIVMHLFKLPNCVD